MTPSPLSIGGRRVPTNLVAALPGLLRRYGIVPLARSLAGLHALGEEQARRIAIAATDRRTKEVGVRKAMGASDGQVLALLLGHLTRPALVAT